MSEEWRVENHNKAFPDWRLHRPDGTTFASAHDDIGAAELRAIADAMNARAWRPIETAPRDGTKVLVFEPAEGVYVAKWFDDGAPMTGDSPGWMGLVGEDEGFCEMEPTQWQPLPPPGDAG